MIDAMIGTFLVIASFCMGLWFGKSRPVKTESPTTPPNASNVVRRARPKFDHTTPFSVSKDKKKGGE